MTSFSPHSRTIALFPSFLLSNGLAGNQSSPRRPTGREWLMRVATDTIASVQAESGVPFVRSTKLARLEAVLLVVGETMSPRRLAQLATLVDAAEVRELIDELNAAYDADGSTFRVERLAGGDQMMTRREVCSWLNKLHHRQAEMKLTPSAMETLSIVAYQQPMTRADLEAIRGVQSVEMLKLLMERGLVKIGGQEESLGRPYLYETTRKFLELYGLRSLDDLPMAEALRRKPKLEAETVIEEAEETETGDESSAEGELPDVEQAA
ncbi:MAG: SMC-Scp complex subunit ScpB [Planctomycetota bacterium]|nr:SMC-Scp complex subunit ScpB [Planctomycetota bacterium]MDA1211634.1 SMC-Scp complex subunit ScpB [Planctomycetota bacterium]